MINIKYHKYIRNCCVNLELVRSFYAWDIEIMAFEVWTGGSFNTLRLSLLVPSFLFNSTFSLPSGSSKTTSLFSTSFSLFLTSSSSSSSSVNLWKLLTRPRMGGIDLFLNVFPPVSKFNKKFVCFDGSWAFFSFQLLKNLSILFGISSGGRILPCSILSSSACFTFRCRRFFGWLSVINLSISRENAYNGFPPYEPYRHALLLTKLSRLIFRHCCRTLCCTCFRRHRVPAFSSFTPISFCSRFKLSATMSHLDLTMWLRMHMNFRFLFSCRRTSPRRPVSITAL